MSDHVENSVMREVTYNSRNSIMDADHNPLRHIPDVNTRHLILQTLAWMCWIIFASTICSLHIIGLNAFALLLLLADIAIVLVCSITSHQNMMTNSADRPIRHNTGFKIANGLVNGK